MGPKEEDDDRAALREQLEDPFVEANDRAWDDALDDGSVSHEEWAEREEAMQEMRDYAYGVDDD